MKQDQSKENANKMVSTKRRNRVLAVTFCLMIAAVSWYIFASSDSTKGTDERINSEPSETVVEDKIATLPMKEVEKVDDEPLEADPFLGKEMKAQFMQVADLYKQNARYPVGSIPVVGERFAKPIEPFEQAEVDTPYPRDDNDEDPIRISASVEKMEYFAGEPIIARVLISGGGVDEYSRIQASGSVINVSAGKDIGLSVNFERIRFNEFRSVIETHSVAPGQIPREALLSLTLELEDGRSLGQTVPFFYNGSPSARLENVVNSRQEGAFLIIPLQYNVFQAGYYFVDAILDDAVTGQPQVQLQTEGRMQFGSGLLTLKAHIHALMDAGSPGPYRLRIINTFRAGSFDESRDVAATVSRPFGYDVQGAAFEQYDDIPYVDPEVQERIDFLEQIGSDNRGKESDASPQGYE